MKTETQYKQLIPGDVRQEGDQQRRKTYDATGFTCMGSLLSGDRTDRWRRADLMGHALLSSDVMIDEFRRPLS